MNQARQIAESVGKIILNFNALEQSFRRLVWFLIDRTNPEKGKVVTKSLTMDNVVALGFALFKASNIPHVDMNAVRSTIKKVDEIKNARNVYAHVCLRVKNDATDLSEIYTNWPQHYKHGAFYSDNVPISYQRLIDDNAQCIETGNEVDVVLNTLGVGTSFGNA